MFSRLCQALATCHLLVHHIFATSSDWDASIASQWQDQDINCTQNQACTILCDMDRACKGSTIVCPENAACDIQCINAYEGCRDVCISVISIIQIVSIPCEYYNQATIIWPMIEGYGTLTCDGGWGCAGVNWPDKPNSTQPLNINSDQGEIHNAQVYCPEYASCNIYCANYAGCRGVC